MSNKKIAVITGASSGMGREFVYAIDKEFELDEIWVIARRADRLESLKTEDPDYGNKKCRTPLRVLSWDLQNPDSFEAYRKLLEEETPNVHVLVNAAGYGLFGYFDELDLNEQLGCVDLNSKALAAFCYISLPYMGQGDIIINMGSNSCWQPVPFQIMYASSKAFVLSFSRGLYKELEVKKRGIHIMCVCPGWIKTEFMNRAVKDNTINYFDRWYTAEEVIVHAMKDLKKKKRISILGAPVRRQVLLVKFLPIDLVLNIWVNQQTKRLK